MPTDAEPAIRRVLEQACPGVRVLSLRHLSAGYSSRHWVADTDEGRLLVKVPQRNRDPEHLRRLMTSTRVAAEHGIPVVRYRCLVPHAPAVDGPVLIQEFQEGAAAADLWESVDDDRREVLCRDLGDIVGRLHGIAGPGFGDVPGSVGATTLRSSVESEVDALLGRGQADLLGDGGALRAATALALSRLDESASVPALTHGDLWLPNFLVRHGRITCVLDFEHAGYQDRFRDFGKLDEHIFDAFPTGRRAFLDAYAAACPLPDDWEQRVDVARMLHALSMHVYFLRWSPQWAPQYAQQVRDWLGSHS
ncbi:phosphotransferase family protein [Streptomyces celluloflavus]|uniref:Phosphotransferase family protein n=1 Tax=Streptomyces celluloflavus TaxID=58344 RepID=A0ABW7RKK4_9ACTN|nr:aminoglycoside phosphotransferase family protein [Streptomyces celluloflavus]WSK17278.1 aminoglycoside phosphotransferase family protein [Streptomyces celluloflavus]